MKKTFYFLLLFFFISCNTNKEDILNSKSDSISYVDSNEELVVSDISKQIGNLHNASIEAFIEYVYSNSMKEIELSPPWQITLLFNLYLPAIGPSVFP